MGDPKGGLERLAGGLLRRRGIVLAVVFVITVFFGWRITRLEFSTSPETILESDYGDLEELREHEAIFGSFEHLVVLVGECENAFDPKTLRTIRKATHALEELSIVGGVRSMVRSGFTLPDPETAPDAFRDAALGNPLVSPFLVSRDEKHVALHVELRPEADKASRREDSLALLEKTARDCGFDARTAGVPALRRAYATSIREDILWLPPVIAVLLVVLLYLAFRRIALVLAPLLVVGLAALWTVGILSVTGGRITALTSILPSLTLVVGIAIGVHVVSAFLEERGKGRDPRTAARRAMVRMALPCCLTALTTAVGFCSLLIARIRDVQEFGLYSAIGVILAFLLGVPLVGILLSFVRARPGAIGEPGVALGRPLRRLGVCIARRPWVAVAMGGGLALLSLAGVTRLESETFLMEDLRPSAPIRQASGIVDRHLGGIYGFDLVVTAPGRLLDPDVVRWMRDLEEELRQDPEIRAVVGPGTLFTEAARSVGLPTIAETAAPRVLEGIRDQGGSDAAAIVVGPYACMARIVVRIGDTGSRKASEIRARVLRKARRSVPEGVRTRIGGLGVFAEELLGTLVREMGKSTILALVAIFLLMSLLFRSVKIGALSMVPNFLPLLAAAGFMGVAGITVRSSVALIFAVALGIAVDDTIHVLTRYRRERKAGKARRGAVLETLRTTGRPVTLTSVVLFLGFLTFLFSGFKATEHFGLISAVTIASALVGDLVLLPGLLLLRRERR